ncbi:hypothetical protein ASA1KI_03720 [Opitutales bacterium ASA1]|uniref:hypothetical protein n=1 Tax=Congregicoccus parvus TaxID=3081749 RepID=UPI002B2E6EC6|nr:hypothetical protein ASA1KI_03720 [Opitutales bacterium ASA1]
MKADLSSVQVLVPPKRDFDFLVHAQPWEMNACLHFMHDMSHGYVEGYRKAAEYLIDHIDRTHMEQDYLVYPVLFLYRHHLELRLKEILGLLHDLGVRSSEAPIGHSLAKLWSEARAPLRKLGGKGDAKWFSAVDRCIKQIDEIDPSSDAFRYAKRRDGSKSVSHVRHVNFLALRETMDAILDWLFGASCALDAYLESME